MSKILCFLMLSLPVSCLAQVTISGRVLNQADTKPVANASVFLSSASIGGNTGTDGKFIMHNARTGTYKLVESIIGFETYSQTITIDNANIELPDIMLVPKTIALNEVSIKYHEDLNRERYYEKFRAEILGDSKLAQECM